MNKERGNTNPSGPGDTATLIRRYGWENAAGIIASRTTCWDFME
jgi:hypothetical protein